MQGIKKGVVKKHTTFVDYKKCYLIIVKQMRTMNELRSHKHNVFAETVNKVALSSADDTKNICEGWYPHLFVRLS